MLKTCSRCKQSKELTEFYKDRSRKDGLVVYCKSCAKDIKASQSDEIKQAWKDKNPNYQKNLYWANPEHYREMARRHYKPRPPKGKPGSIRYEAKLAGFRSGFERTIDSQLRVSRLKYSYETLKLPYSIESIYTPDFILENGIILEVKGYLDTETKRKMIAVKKHHPTMDIRFIFMDAHKKISGTKSTHGQWATRNGFPFADKEVPQAWLDE